MNGILTRMVRPVAPSVFARRGRPVSVSRVVVCAGDSLTHGLISANYVTLLESAHLVGDTAFVNAGISGELAWNLAERLGEIVACRPDVVTILIGTNDALAQIDDAWCGGYIKDQHLPQQPTLEWYREQLARIVHRLQLETTARIVLLTIPPIGEDLDSRYNALTGEVNDIIREVAAEFGIEVVDVHQRLVATLPAGRIAPRFDGSKRLMGKAFPRRVLLRKSFDRIAAGEHRILLVDDIHLTERGARIVADLILETLTVDS